MLDKDQKATLNGYVRNLGNACRDLTDVISNFRNNLDWKYRGTKKTSPPLSFLLTYGGNVFNAGKYIRTYLDEIPLEARDKRDLVLKANVLVSCGNGINTLVTDLEKDRDKNYLKELSTIKDEITIVKNYLETKIPHL